ncbi:hypothetical protein QUV83_08430 [Cellulomonas cellasea]|uniref:hypothetical protein n=1 Tax=Cellulomonas cellasea TaxID=43670 RepID=UPI0025A4527F|nr:hypothetical protein [Cellulomonas cellasea]MDM8084786.1 hypothetical protein [Cellulomonas cellasea]
MSDIRPGGQPGQPAERPSEPSLLWPQGLDGAAVPPASETAAPAHVAEPSDDAARKRRTLLIGGIAAGVLVVGGLTTAVLLNRDDAPQQAADAATVFLPSPTPTVAPAAREAATPFATALPASVLQFALATSVNDDAWLAAGAIEAYTETYTDGGAGTVTVQAGQWETAEEAAAHAQRLAAELPAAAAAPAASATASADSTAPALTPESGEVTVAGTAVGTYTWGLVGADGVAVWSNGTTVFRVTGPAEEIRDFYNAYPL